MEYISNWIRQNFGLSVEIQENLLSSVVIVLFLVLVRKVVLIFVQRGTKDVALRYRWRKSSTYVMFGFAVLILGSIWFRGFQSLATYLALVSAGIAIALQVPLVNLAGWIFIIWRRPFVVGDRIEIGSVKGDVVDLRIFMFTLLEIGNRVDAEQSTGRVIHVPNGRVFHEPVANYTEGFKYIWNEIAVLLTFESNWETAKEILIEIADKHGEEISKSAELEIKRAANTKMILINKLTPIVYTSVKDSGVLLTLRYFCDSRARRDSEQNIWEDILRAFKKRDDIDFAYPTERRFVNYIEGKPDARATESKG